MIPIGIVSVFNDVILVLIKLELLIFLLSIILLILVPLINNSCDVFKEPLISNLYKGFVISIPKLPINDEYKLFPKIIKGLLLTLE